MLTVLAHTPPSVFGALSLLGGVITAADAAAHGPSHFDIVGLILAFNGCAGTAYLFYKDIRDRRDTRRRRERRRR